MSTLPPDDDFLLLRERLDAGDVAWVGDAYRSGRLVWLRDRLGPGEYDALGDRLATGDVAWLRERVVAFGPEDATVAVAPTAAVVAEPTVALPASADRTVVHVAETPRDRSGLWAALGLAGVLLAALVAFAVWRAVDDDDDATQVTADTTVPAETTVPVETTAPAETTVPVETTVPTETTLPVETTAAVATTVAPATTLPAEDVLTIAARSGTFGPFLQLVEAAGLGVRLRDDGPYTVFAPTESAFDGLPAGTRAALLDPANRAVLERIVAYHVLARRATSDQLAPGSVQTLEGSLLRVARDGDRVTVGGAHVTGADVAAANAVLHAVDTLLLPPGVDLADLTRPAVTPPATAVPTTARPATTPPPTTTAPGPTTTTPPPTTAAPATVASTTPSATVTVLLPSTTVGP